MTTEPKTISPPRAKKVPNHGLAPVAYNDTVMPALRLARSSRAAKRVARVLLVMLGMTLVMILVAPWQQSVTGSGNVIAFAPLERQQTIEAPVKGRIVRWADEIYENAYVQEGQPIVEIEDVDPLLLERLREQLAMAENQETAVAAQLVATEAARNNIREIIQSFEQQLTSYREIKQQMVAAADAYVEMARQKVAAEDQNLAEQEAALEQEREDFDRQKYLFERNVASQLKFQMAERKYREATAKVAKARAYLDSARQELEGKSQERHATEQRAQVAIDGAEAALQKAKGDAGKADSDVAKVQSDLNKVRSDVVSMRSRVSSQENQVVRAPRSGYILRVAAFERGQFLKEGDTLAVIVPDTEDRAVQIWLSGNDAPLVEPGRHVRLQFEGWPAVQFAGWPSVAVGTFGGSVASVDATDDGQGRFRCLIVPDQEDIAWPSDRFLRQGVRANGWILLERVPLWYEVWRRLNGFPPAIDMKEGAGGGYMKVPKLPKA